MEPKKEEWYIGIELGNDWTMVSCYGEGMKEPETKGLVTGSQSYRIPAAICKRPGISQWYLTEKPEGIFVEHLLERALREENVEMEEEVYAAKELFFVYLRKVMRMVLPAQGMGVVTRCVFTVEQVTQEITELLSEAAEVFGLRQEQILIQDNRESFYAYAVSQEPELWMYEAALFSCEKEKVTYWGLVQDKKTMPRISRVMECVLGELPEEAEEKDAVFSEMVQKALNGRIISCVYLIGEGFEGGWMKESLQVVCRGHRAFQGKNLYTRGACYGGLLDAHAGEQDTVYFCDYKTKNNIFLRVSDKEREYMYPLVEAGRNRYQVQKNCRILLEGGQALDVWIQSPGKKEAVIESLELSGLETAEEKKHPLEAVEKKRYRLELQVKGSLEDSLQLMVRDIGMGELFPGSLKEWEYEIG